MKGPLEHAKLLLKKASHDLLNAEMTICDERILDTVCFHAQQTIEKDLKALLALRDIEYPHTHNLQLLFDLVAPLFPAMSGVMEEAVPLSAHAVHLCYGTAPDPNAAQARAALAVARRTHELAKEIIAAAPQTEESEQG